MSKNGQTIGNIDLGSSIKMLNNNQGQSNNKGDESVDDLIQKLAKKGKKVKLIDESGSVKELPRQEDDSDFERDAPSSVKKKLNKIKKQRAEEDGGISAKKLIEQ